MQDHVEKLIKQWAIQRPDLDCLPMAVIARIGRTNRFLDTPVTSLMREFDLSRIEFDILATLRRANRPLTPTNLYKETLLSSGTMSNKLEILVGRELVQRVSNDSDRRSCLVELTETGKDLIDHAFQAHLENEATLLSALPRVEQEQLANLLAKLALSLENAKD